MTTPTTAAGSCAEPGTPEAGRLLDREAELNEHKAQMHTAVFGPDTDTTTVTDTGGGVAGGPRRRLLRATCDVWYPIVGEEAACAHGSGDIRRCNNGKQ